jgi:peptide/nickel transport system substrate-binding protein
VSAGGTGTSEFAFFFSTGLTVFDANGVLRPRLAQKVPSVEDGDWKILPDGGMEVTWKLRPNAVWHDGAPLTAADYEFGSRLLFDRAIPTFGRDGYNSTNIASATAVDAQTLVVHWKGPYLYANASAPNALPPVPRHLLLDLYEKGDTESFIRSPYWTTEYVGVGPFRLTSWVEGSSIEGVAFDQYVHGRPKVDRIIVRLIPDLNSLTVNLLAGEIDLVTVGNLRLAELKTIVERWGATGEGTGIPILQGTRALWPQFRDASAPWARDTRVREALWHMLDRQSLSDVLMLGFSGPADALIDAGDPTWPLLEQRGFKRRPFDLGQAQRLMAEAGWNRAPDGTYRDGSGSPFTIEVRGGSDYAQEITIATAQWKEAGLDSVLYVIPDSTANQRELQATFPGVLATGGGNYDGFIEASIATADNRWTGNNRGAYRSAPMERLYQDWQTNQFVEAQRLPRQADILKLANDDVVALQLYYNARPQAWSKRIRGPGPYQTPLTLQTSWNIHEWEVL